MRKPARAAEREAKIVSLERRKRDFPLRSGRSFHVPYERAAARPTTPKLVTLASYRLPAESDLSPPDAVRVWLIHGPPEVTLSWNS